MRKILMLFLLLPLSICAASWQAFEEGQKLPDGMQWAIFSYVYPQNYYTEIYRIAGDSVIDGKVFKKVLTSRNEDFSNATLERYMLRNEGSRIYLRWHSGKEDLFFDCNSEVGDTLILQGGNPAIITSVKDTVFDNVKGDKLKCWEMILGEYDSNNEVWDFWWEATYIENVGFLSTGHAQTHFLQTGGGNELLYVSVGDSLIYLCEEGIYYKSSETGILPDGRKWIVRRALPLHPDKIEETMSYYIKGDTTINGYKYSKLYNGAKFTKAIRKEGIRYFSHIHRDNKDTLVFDESWNVGDTTVIGDPDPRDPRCTVAETGYIQGRKYWDIIDIRPNLRWVQGVGFVNAGVPFQTEHGNASSATFSLICCTEANGDTLYVNRNFLYMLTTGIRNISVEDISIKQQGGECTVTLPDAAKWSATLYNSNGVAVVRKAGEGSEIILPAESKGIHILVLNIDGKEYTNKVTIK